MRLLECVVIIRLGLVRLFFIVCQKCVGIHTLRVVTVRYMNDFLSCLEHQ